VTDEHLDIAATAIPPVAGDSSVADDDAAGPLVLTAPAPVTAVAPTQAAGAVPIATEDKTRLDGMVAS
jgi:hypothetical protein